MNAKCSDCCHPEFVNREFCGCCEGIEVLTPLATANRPGLSQLSYRIGTHGSFLETMTARLSSNDFPELQGLTTRERDDPSIAMLDAWATVADVLTFYQERIANEGYLRTAGERRSILELARLVGYKLRPGVASSVFLAYTIDENTQDEVTIPIGSRVQSVPGPDELPQSFETSEDLKARATWNNLKPRMNKPQTADTIMSDLNLGARVYLKGISTNLKPNDPLLIDLGTGNPSFHRVKEVKTNAEADRTLVILQGSKPETAAVQLLKSVHLIEELVLKPSVQPANSARLAQKIGEQFKSTSETGYMAVSTLAPQLRGVLSAAAANAEVTPDIGIKVYALRAKASLFGHNAPREPQYEPALIPEGEFSQLVPNPNAGNLRPQPWPEWTPQDELPDVLFLDRSYDEILPGSYVAIQELDSSSNLNIRRVDSVQSMSRNAYGISMETMRITLDQDWWTPSAEDDIARLRTTTVCAQSEELELADEPIDALVCGGSDDLIELDGFYEALEPGRWVVVAGERDIEGTSGVRVSELAMLSSVSQSVQTKLQTRSGNSTLGGFSAAQGPGLPGDKIHTFIRLANNLSYCFKRDTVKIYGNVVKATHGETRKEVLGSGDASKALQSFELKQPPLTFVSASNPSGADSTLKVFVNDIRWRETDSLAGLKPSDRNFVTKTSDEAKTTVIFGNGNEGVRPPTGIENIRAEYRNGIGKPGNVRAGQITLLATKPLGVKEVINPLRASGGADRESRDQARHNAPLAVMALDRLVSVQDYEDFSRTYAGIGKASAVELSDGRRQVVHVTIAGADDIPIDENSDLFRNLRQALHDFGDPFQPIELAVRELMLIVISANVRIQPDYQWELLVADLRTALLDAFSFGRRELGQDVLLSTAISVMQKVRGVAYVDVDVLAGIPEKKLDNGERRLLTPDEITEAVNEFIEKAGELNRPEPRIRVNLADYDDKDQAGNKIDAPRIHPAQLAFLTPEVPATLILNRIE
jgi:hypothetical protein